MKVTFVLPALYGTGGIKVVYEYASRLQKRGHDVTVYAPIKAYNMHRGKLHVDLLKQVYATCKVIKSIFFDNLPQKIEKHNGIKIRPVWKISNNYLQDADIVVATAWCTAFDVNKLENSKGKKVYFIQGYEIWDNPVMGKNSYKLPIKKIVIAAWIKEKLVTECGCRDVDIDIINNGIDIKKYHPNKETNKENKVMIRCLMLDHSLEKKGVKYGVAAFTYAKEIVPELKLTMFGIKKSQYAPKNIDYFENTNQETLVKLYQQSDIFIFPSLEEGWGLTPIEAMACGCAVVGTNVGCMLDIGVDRKNVILCEKANSEDMAKKIVELATNTVLRERIAVAGNESVQQLDWEKATDKFEQIILEIGKNRN